MVAAADFANFGYLGDVSRLAELASDAEAAGSDAVFLSGTLLVVARLWLHSGHFLVSFGSIDSLAREGALHSDEAAGRTPRPA